VHAAVCDFILDCLQNSIEAAADVIVLEITETAGMFSVVIKDDGIGMTGEQLKRAVDPFYTDGLKHKKRKVGLGLPFLIQAVDQSNGIWSLDSEKGKGTRLGFSFRFDNVDTPPVGDISMTLLQAFMFDGDFELEVSRKLNTGKINNSYLIRRKELIDILGDLNNADSLILAKQFLRSQEEGLKEGDSDG
jgi:hypothetical protein